MAVIERIASLDSPTATPPIAYPGKSRASRGPAIRARRSSWVPPWRIPKRSPWPLYARRDRSAQSSERRQARSTSSRAAGNGGQTSSAIAMSTPKSDCSCIASSGVRKWAVPSSGERNSTPSCESTRRDARLMT